MCRLEPERIPPKPILGSCIVSGPPPERTPWAPISFFKDGSDYGFGFGSGPRLKNVKCHSEDEMYDFTNASNQEDRMYSLFVFGMWTAFILSALFMSVDMEKGSYAVLFIALVKLLSYFLSLVQWICSRVAPPTKRKNDQYFD